MRGQQQKQQCWERGSSATFFLLQPHNSIMRNRTGGTIASGGLCLAATVALLLPSPSLAFRPHAVIGAARTHDNYCRRPSSAACRLAARNIVDATGGDDSSEHERRRLQHAAASSAEETPARQHAGSKVSKDVAAVVLSALLLGNPQLSDAAMSPVGALLGGGAASSSGRPDTTTTVTQQDRLMADLEKKLMTLPSPEDERPAPPPSSSQEDATSERTATATASSSRQQQSIGDAAQQQQQQEPTVQTQAMGRAAYSADLGTAAQQSSRKPAPAVGAIGSGEGKPMVRLQEYTFSVTLPELNLPPIAPITLPEEGGLFQMPNKRFERVEASPSLPMGRAIRDALVRAEKGGDVANFFSAVSARMPKQADYYRCEDMI